MSRAVFHPAANSEFLDSAKFYERQCEGLGAEFIDCIEDCRDRILRNPEIGRPEVADCRSMKTDRFPFRLFYQIEPDRIWIVAVAHLSRSPNYWSDRTQS
jgi:toxin ParE1/3/4